MQAFFFHSFYIEAEQRNSITTLFYTTSLNNLNAFWFFFSKLNAIKDSQLQEKRNKKSFFQFYDFAAQQQLKHFFHTYSQKLLHHKFFSGVDGPSLAVKNNRIWCGYDGRIQLHNVPGLHITL